MDKITKINLQSGSVPPMEDSTHVSLETPMAHKKSNLLLPLVIVGIVAGVVTGFVVAKQRLLIAGGPNTTIVEDAGTIKVGTVAGAQDESLFKASQPAEGVVQPGGLSGEGSHHLVRGANESQWVYITSSVIDLDQYVGHKVMIWGETLQGKKAGWLMDVGRLKVLELNAAEIDAIEPTEE